MLTGYAASVFSETFCLRRAPALFCYYLFSAAIMHVTSCTSRFYAKWSPEVSFLRFAVVENAQDLPAAISFQKTYILLKRMAVR